MRPLALAATATLLGACALAPVASTPSARTVTVRGVVATQGAGYALQGPPASPAGWALPYTAQDIATIHVALEQAPEASGTDAFDDLDAGDCDASLAGDFPSPDYTALPVVAGSAPPLVISGLPLGQYYRVTLQAESAASGPISCPAMSRRLFNTVGPGVPSVIATHFPVTLFKNPKYETNFAGGVNVTEGDVVASGVLGPRVDAVSVVGCTSKVTVATAQLSSGTATTWEQLVANSANAPIYVESAQVGYRLAILPPSNLKSGYFRTLGFQRVSPSREVCVTFNGETRSVEVWQAPPS